MENHSQMAQYKESILSRVQTDSRANSFFAKLNEKLKKSDIVYLTGASGIGKTNLIAGYIKRMQDLQHYNSKYLVYCPCNSFEVASTSVERVVKSYLSFHKLPLGEITVFLDNYTGQDLDGLKEMIDKLVVVSSFQLGEEFGHQEEILGIDFDDYLRIQKVELTTKNLHLVETYFREFLIYGNNPGFLGLDRVTIFDNLQTILAIRIAVQGNLDMKLLLKVLFYLEKSIGKVVSINSVAKKFQISPDTVSRYFDLLEEIYLIKLVAKYRAEKLRYNDPRMIFSGIQRLASNFSESNMRELFKNFLALRFNELQYISESDFIVGKVRFVIPEDDFYKFYREMSDVVGAK